MIGIHVFTNEASFGIRIVLYRYYYYTARGNMLQKGMFGQSNDLAGLLLYVRLSISLLLGESCIRISFRYSFFPCVQIGKK